MTDSVNGSNCLSDRLMRSGLRRYLQSTTKQLCDSNLVYHCCWRSQSTLNNSNISWEFIYALWWEVFRLGMSANLITWRWLQLWELKILTSLLSPCLPTLIPILQFVSFWVYFHSSKSHFIRFLWLTMEWYPFTQCTSGWRDKYPVTSPPSRLTTKERSPHQRTRHQAKSSRHQPPIKRLVEDSRMFGW